MAIVTTDNKYYAEIAAAIREKLGTDTLYTPSQMAEAILSIQAGPSTIPITAANIQEYFTVTNDSYYFAGNGSTFTTNNGGVNNATAQTVLTALFDMTVSFTYSYSSETNYDKFTLIVGSTTVENGVSGATTTKQYTGTISAGTTITFTYTKDSSANNNDDQCTFSGMTVTGYF